MTAANSSLSTRPSAHIGGIVDDRYEVHALVGEGAMGAVFKVKDLERERCLALKVLRPECNEDAAIRKRFLDESKAVSNLRHENIAEIFDFGETNDGLLYFTMELLGGEELGERLRREGPLSWPEAKALVVQICRPLIEAHAQGIIHRDIKPANCFLTQSDTGKLRVVLLDFGIAKNLGTEQTTMTQAGTVLGTASYMAPEQAQGEAIDARADVWSVGVVLYQMVTGRLPFEGEGIVQVLGKVLTADVPRPSSLDPTSTIAPELESVIMKALSRETGDRYPSMRAFSAAIEAIADGAGVATQNLTRAMLQRSSPAPLQRRRGLVAKVGMGLAGLSLLVGVVLASEVAGFVRQGNEAVAGAKALMPEFSAQGGRQVGMQLAAKVDSVVQGLSTAVDEISSEAALALASSDSSDHLAPRPSTPRPSTPRQASSNKLATASHAGVDEVLAAVQPDFVRCGRKGRKAPRKIAVRWRIDTAGKATKIELPKRIRKRKAVRCARKVLADLRFPEADAGKTVRRVVRLRG